MRMIFFTFLLVLSIWKSPNAAAVELGDTSFIPTDHLYNNNYKGKGSVPLIEYAEFTVDDIKGKKIRGTVRRCVSRHGFNGGVQQWNCTGNYKENQGYWFDQSKVFAKLPPLPYKIPVSLGDGNYRYDEPPK